MTAPPIVIINFNSGDHLARCLASIRQHAPASAVVVIDNASSDGSEQSAAAEGGTVTLVRNRDNRGFGRAVNQAVATLATTGHDSFLLLNPDCRLEPGTLAVLEDELRAHPRCALAAPAIRDDDGSVQGSVRGDPTLMTGLFGRTTLLSRLLPNSAMTRRNVPVSAIGPGTPSREADWVSGACMLIRRTAFAAVDGFDERYFLYWEDADLCRRLRQARMSIRYVPAVAVWHTGGGSSRSAQALATRAFHASAYRYYATHVAGNPVTRAMAWLLLAVRCQVKLARLRGRG